MNILVIDDELVVRRSLIRVGESRGHVMKAAEDGISGLKLWEKFNPDLVYLDVLMPGLTGPQVLKELEGQHNSKVILISAYSGKYNLEKAKSIGADLYIPKPFEDIFSVLEEGEGLVKDV